MSRPNKIVSINTKENPSAAFERSMRGVNLLADAVKQTLGPYGRNFILEKSGGKITNDGISIAREIQANDEVEDIALRVAREATIKTNDDAGDGTTTATTLVQAILATCYKHMAQGKQLAQKSVVSMKQQIEREAKEVIEKLKAMATPIETEEQLIEAVMVSVEDRDLAELIGRAQWALGKDGVILVEENTDPVCVIEKIRGIRIDNGLGTSMVMNDMEKQRLVVENVPILLTNHTVQTLAPFVVALQELVTSGKREIVLLARAFSHDAIKEIMKNHEKGIKIFPMNAPYVNQREILKDLQSVVGGRYIHDEESSLDDVVASDFGFASRVIGYRYSAIITGEKDYSARVEVLKQELAGEPSKFQKKALEARISQLENGFALLKVGSLSDVDRKYKLDKAEDACNTSRSALQEGTVPGAGLSYKIIADEMSDDYLLKEPLKAPYRQIMENAGGVFEVEPWVRNSLKVDRVAFENAAQVAADFVTMGGTIVAEKIKPLDQLLKHAQQPTEE